jgi:hypothetical protein
MTRNGTTTVGARRRPFLSQALATALGLATGDDLGAGSGSSLEAGGNPTTPRPKGAERWNLEQRTAAAKTNRT